MTRRIALFGGSFNPPGSHHREIVREAAKRCDEVIVVPCGPRPDKGSYNDVEPLHHAAMVDKTFCDLPGVRVDLFDLEQDRFTRTVDLLTRYASEGEVWLLVGADLVVGADDRPEIRRDWYEGERLWREARFLIVTRAGGELDESALPPRHEILRLDLEGASSTIRDRAYRGESLEGLVVPEVADTLERYGLYCGAPARRQTRVRWDSPRCLVCADDTKPEARAIAERMPSVQGDERPDVVVVVGGDGIMLQAIRKYWRLRVPFLGRNVGQRGFLLNEVHAVDPASFDHEFVLDHLPLLWVEMTSKAGDRQHYVAFNDAWIERSGGQAAWV